MKLTPHDRAVIGCAELSANASIASIVNNLKCRSHSVRYALEKLQRQCVIQKFSCIDTFRLGYNWYSLRIAFGDGTNSEHQKLLEALKRFDKVAMIIELGGDFNLELKILVKSTAELAEFLEYLGEKFPNTIGHKSLVAVVGYTMFGTKQYRTSNCIQDRISVCTCADAVSIDKIDHLILKCISENADISSRDLARQLGLPSSTVSYRIKHLEASGIITGYQYAVWGGNVGLNYYAFLLQTKSFDRKLNEEMISYARSSRYVRSLTRTLGAWDFEVKITVERVEEVASALQELKSTFSNRFVNIKTVPYFTLHKLKDYPFCANPYEDRNGAATS